MKYIYIVIKYVESSTFGTCRFFEGLYLLALINMNPSIGGSNLTWCCFLFIFSKKKRNLHGAADAYLMWIWC